MQATANFLGFFQRKMDRIFRVCLKILAANWLRYYCTYHVGPFLSITKKVRNCIAAKLHYVVHLG